MEYLFYCLYFLEDRLIKKYSKVKSSRIPARVLAKEYIKMVKNKMKSNSTSASQDTVFGDFTLILSSDYPELMNQWNIEKNKVYNIFEYIIHNYSLSSKKSSFFQTFKEEVDDSDNIFLCEVMSFYSDPISTGVLPSTKKLIMCSKCKTLGTHNKRGCTA
jgi:hypothetical protein